jgi:large subunit ribosomal protein L23
MGILDRIKQKPTSSKKTSEETKKTVEKTEEVLVAPGSVSKSTASSLLLVAPHVSEKAAVLASKGTYVFDVPCSANKLEVRKAVESLYSVHVSDVRMVRGKGKVVRRGRVAGSRKDWKKALVSLKKGEKLDLYQGV